MTLLTDAEAKIIEQYREIDHQIIPGRASTYLGKLLNDRAERTRLLREVLRVYSVARCDELKCGQCDGLHDSQLDDTTLLAEIREAGGDA